MLYADVFDGFHTGRKISNFMKQKRDALFCQRRLQRVQLRINQCSLTWGHIMRLPLFRRGDIEREYMCRTIPTSRRQREIVVQTQITPKPDQMRGHNTP